MAIYRTALVGTVVFYVIQDAMSTGFTVSRLFLIYSTGKSLILGARRYKDRILLMLGNLGADIRCPAFDNGTNQ
jgi:hypothetical protein